MVGLVATNLHAWLERVCLCCGAESVADAVRLYEDFCLKGRDYYVHMARLREQGSHKIDDVPTISKSGAEVREVIRVTGQLETVVTSISSADARKVPQPVPLHPHSQAFNTPQPQKQVQDARLLPSVAPVTAPMSEQQLQLLVDAISSSRNVVAITGAGCSTEAGIPDYRGPQGAYTRHGFKPMTHQQFMAGAAQRARYFARSFFGWHEFASSKPAGAHEGLARLVQQGWISHVITQNVDRLHHKAGTPEDRILELHGTTHIVRCLSCNKTVTRKDLQSKLAALNPAAAEKAALLEAAAANRAAEQQRHARLRHQTLGEAHTPASSLQNPKTTQHQPNPDTPQQKEIVSWARPSTQFSEDTQDPTSLVPVRRPDGDVELQDAGQGFIVPPCDECGGVLKPNVVFFGDNIPKERALYSLELAGKADLLLVVGSSLMVYSAYRLVEACKRNGGRIILINCGATRADPVADLKLEVLAGEAMMRLAAHPSLLIPRIA